MTTANPLLRDDEFVAYSDIRPEHVMPAVEARIADCRARIEALVADPAQHRFDTLMLAWEDCEDALNRCFAPVGHLHNVRDTPEWREAYGEAIELLTDFGTEIGQHAGLCAAVRSIRARADFDALPAAARKLVEDALLDFRLAGVDLPPDKQQRYRAIATELSRLSTEFEQAVLDATEAWTLDLTEGDARLAGLPESALALLKQAAQDAKADGLRITLQPPVYQALMMHADDRALRQEAYTAFGTRASDQGPQAGTLRQRSAHRADHGAALRGRAPARLRQSGDALAGDQDGAERPSACSASCATSFPARGRRRSARLADLGRLRDGASAADRRRCSPGTCPTWRRSCAGALPAVERGAEALLPAAARAGGPVRPDRIAVRRARGGAHGVPVWHADVRYYELVDRDERVVAAFYLDAYARAKKRGGAWMDVCRTRFRMPTGWSARWPT
jgi:oligopeptidase A